MGSASATARARIPPLPKPYDTPSAAEALRPSAATLNLVSSQVDALLAASPSYHALASGEQQKLRASLLKIAAYSAELIRDDWYQSRRLGQTPVLRRREVIEVPATETAVARAQTAADDFRPAAASQVGRITRETLNAVAFPTFVADLIHSTFNAITQSSIQQMEAYSRLLENVSRTVEDFENNSVSDEQAHSWLAETYPNHLRLQNGRAAPRPNADERTQPDFQRDLDLGGSATLDGDSIEETLVPAARRRLAQSRLQTLSTLVLMGMNRIIITGGKIRATMGFHIDTTDRAHAESATDLDFRSALQAQVGFGWWGASASVSVAYVSSTRADSDAEINVDTDLTGEVELHFRSETFPLQRFAGAGTINQIRSHTAVPVENTPPGSGASGSGNPLGDAPAAGGEVGKYQSPRSRRSERRTPSLRRIGDPLPEARRPVAPDAVQGDLLREDRRVGTQGPQQPGQEESHTEEPTTDSGGGGGAARPTTPATPDGGTGGSRGTPEETGGRPEGSGDTTGGGGRDGDVEEGEDG